MKSDCFLTYCFCSSTGRFKRSRKKRADPFQDVSQSPLFFQDSNPNTHKSSIPVLIPGSLSKDEGSEKRAPKNIKKIRGVISFHPIPNRPPKKNERVRALPKRRLSRSVITLSLLESSSWNPWTLWLWT